MHVTNNNLGFACEFEVAQRSCPVSTKYGLRTPDYGLGIKQGLRYKTQTVYKVMKKQTMDLTAVCESDDKSEHVSSKMASNGGKGGCDHFALFSVDFKESENMIV